MDQRDGKYMSCLTYAVTISQRATSNRSQIQDQRLLEALQSYEDEKWRNVAHRVGNGVTPMGCCDRVWELFNIQVDDASPFTFANDN